jgi:uncharacterized membrane protein
MTQAMAPWSTVDVILHATHVWAWGLYAGSLVYIYFRLFPDMRRWLPDEERFEAFSLATGHGLRWWIYGALGLSAASGALLLARAGAHGTAFTALMGLKIALFVVAVAVYTRVSYVMWPARVFVASADRAAEQRRFFRVALGLLALLVAQALAGAAAHVR